MSDSDNVTNKNSVIIQSANYSFHVNMNIDNNKKTERLSTIEDNDSENDIVQKTIYFFIIVIYIIMV